MPAHTFYPDSPVAQLEHSEYWQESSGEGCQIGRRPIGTYVMA
jgi:hypothetical protein